MQSYSIQKQAQSLESLKNLGSQLHLPSGCRFHTKTLPHAAYLTPDRENAVVIQDDFLNTYQLETKIFTSQ